MFALNCTAFYYFYHYRFRYHCRFRFFYQCHYLHQSLCLHYDYHIINSSTTYHITGAQIVNADQFVDQG